jgi:hypothetical protein
LDRKSSILNIKSNGVTRGGTQAASVQEQQQGTKKLYRPKRGQATTGWTNCSSEELLELNSTTYIVKIVN